MKKENKKCTCGPDCKCGCKEGKKCTCNCGCGKNNKQNK